MTALTPATRIFTLTRLRGLVKKLEDAERVAYAQHNEVEQRDVAKIGDAKLGTVSVANGRSTFVLKDERAMLEWARQNAPHMIVEGLRAADVRSLKAKPFDPETGELLPGWEPDEGAPTIRVTTAKDTDVDALIAEAITAGEFEWRDVLELER